MDNEPRYNPDFDEDFMGYDSEFQTHYNSWYSASGYPYDYYTPAYHYGYQLANDERYFDWDWEHLEPEARREWELRDDVQGAWEDFKDGVRYARETVKREVRDAVD
jgi:hypothetical protein